MVVFVGTPLFRRIGLWVAMETMHLNIARISFQLGTFLGGHTWGPNEQFDTHQHLPWCRKVGKIRS